MRKLYIPLNYLTRSNKLLLFGSCCMLARSAFDIFSDCYTSRLLFYSNIFIGIAFLIIIILCIRDIFMYKSLNKKLKESMEDINGHDKMDPGLN